MGNTENENKRKFALWMYPLTFQKIKNIYKQDNCGSQSEFIEKAVNFYIGYLAGEENVDYFSRAVSASLKALIKSSEDRISRLQFKEAVELAKIVRMIAPLCELDEDELHRLHLDCVDEVKRINGVIKLDSVLRGEI